MTAAQRLREHLGLDQAAFAQAIRRSRIFVLYVERGEKNFGPETIDRIFADRRLARACRELGLEPWDFIRASNGRKRRRTAS